MSGVSVSLDRPALRAPDSVAGAVRAACDVRLACLALAVLIDTWNSRTPGVIPRSCMSSLNERSASRCASRGRWTNEPRPGTRRMRPIDSSESMAARTVMRATLNCSASTRSEGMSIPALDRRANSSRDARISSRLLCESVSTGVTPCGAFFVRANVRPRL